MLNRRVYIVFGLMFGDEGKGTIVDFIVRHSRARSVVRFTGGPQAGHDVVTSDGIWHRFSQYGSGLLVPETLSILSGGMIVYPEPLENESLVLTEKIGRNCRPQSIISASCALITPAQQMLNQMQELARGDGRYGSCGLGVGLTAEDRRLGRALTVGDVLFSSNTARDKLLRITEQRHAQAVELLEHYQTPELQERYEHFVDQLNFGLILAQYRQTLSGFTIDRYDTAVPAALVSSPVVFESAQGALLHPQYGFQPYVTKTDPTCRLAMRFVDNHQAVKVGVLRAFGHRHGAGPFVTENRTLAEKLFDPYNPINDWQGEFRLGWPDLVMMRYGLQLNNGADILALTNLDRLAGIETIPICTSYRYVGPLAHLDQFFEWEKLSRASARIVAIKPFVGDKRDANRRTEILFRCEPYDWVEFTGWNEISTAHSWNDLPRATQNYVQYLETQLQVPISIVSIGPTAEHKIVR